MGQNTSSTDSNGHALKRLTLVSETAVKRFTDQQNRQKG
jgi:hypothetical protein